MFEDSSYQDKTETMYLVAEISVNVVSDPGMNSLEVGCRDNSRLLKLEDMLKSEEFRKELTKLGWYESQFQRQIEKEDVDSLNLGPGIFRIKNHYGELRADRIDFQTHPESRWSSGDLQGYAIELSEEFVRKFRPDLLQFAKKARSKRESADKKIREEQQKKIKEAAKLLMDHGIPVGDLGSDE